MTRRWPGSGLLHRSSLGGAGKGYLSNLTKRWGLEGLGRQRSRRAYHLPARPTQSPIAPGVRTAGRARSGAQTPPNRFIEPNPPDLQNRQAVVAQRLVGSTPAPLRWRSTCKWACSGGGLHPGSSFRPAGLETGRDACRRRSPVGAVLPAPSRISAWLSGSRYLAIVRGRSWSPVSGALEGTVQNVEGAMAAQNLGRRRPRNRAGLEPIGGADRRSRRPDRGVPLVSVHWVCGYTPVCQPTVRVLLEVPADTVGAIVAALGRRGASIAMPAEPEGDLATVETVLSAVRARDLQRQRGQHAAKEWSKRLSRAASRERGSSEPAAESRINPRTNHMVTAASAISAY